MISRLVRTAAVFGAIAVGVVQGAVQGLRSLSRSVAGQHNAPPHWKTRMKRWVFEAVALLAVFAVGGFLVVALGIVPIKASSGHWPITVWFLHFAMRRSVATHTLGLETPSLDDPSLVLKGAGHYETGCRPCHGSPEQRIPRIPQGMTPHPPYLPPAISEWEPNELFYIVKHGVKFTGMPAWPTQQRDDEVWAMVAFLRTLPDLDAEAYQRLVHGEGIPSGTISAIHGLLGPEPVPRAVTESCGRCHGVGGRGRGAGAFPKLAGQRPTYLFAALQAFARGERHSGIMGPIAAGLSLVEMRELALYYGNQTEPLPQPPHRATSLAIERGKAIASQGIPSQRVPSCVDCHGPSVIRRNPIYPMLAGQYADYLILQLELFKKRRRGGTAYAHIMHEVADELTPEQMHDVALYYASLPATLDRPAQ